MIRFLGIPLLVIASLLALAACNGKSSSNAAEQSSTAAEATAAPTPTPDSPRTVYGVAVFPDAIVVPASTLNVHGTNMTVLSTDEVYNEVLTWYDARNPGVPQSRSQGEVPSAVFKIQERDKHGHGEGERHAEP